MLESETDGDDKGVEAPSPEFAPEPDAEAQASPATNGDYDESLLEEVGALIDDAKLYATAELAFQKTRAGLIGKNAGIAAGAVVVAIILLHISIIALAVGLVMALAPLVTIWGAIAIVVGVMLLGVAGLGYLAYSKGMLIAEMFAKDEEDEADDGSSEAGK